MKYDSSADWYTDEEGNHVFTARYYRKKNSCCKSSCLHCPYGHTLRNIGLSLSEYSDQLLEQAWEVLEENGIKRKQDIASSLLDSAWGAPKSKFKIEDLLNNDWFIISLKNKILGLVQIKNKRVKKLYLKFYFREQGIDEAYIESIL